MNQTNLDFSPADFISFQTEAASPAGFLLVDKPSGWTSHDVVAKVRNLLRVSKVGHAGTLDPLATGLLVVLVGRTFTKRQSEIMGLDKTYLVTAELGKTSDTHDVDGQVSPSADWSELKTITKDRIESALDSFRGQIRQTVPAFSAVKVQGQKLYELARQDQAAAEEKLPTRTVQIHGLELLAFQPDSGNQTAYLGLKVHCSSGTYVRSLVHDLGQVLKVGAVVFELRRTKIGSLSVDQAETLPIR